MGKTCLIASIVGRRQPKEAMHLMLGFQIFQSNDFYNIILTHCQIYLSMRQAMLRLLTSDWDVQIKWPRVVPFHSKLLF